MLPPSAPSQPVNPMRPLRHLYAALFVAQVLGAVCGLWLARYPTWLENLWVGAAAATFPGFLAGCVVQKTMGEAALKAHNNTVRRIGLAALLLTLAVFFMPFGR